MILGMSSYNSFLKNGFDNSMVLGIIIPFIPVYLIALTIDWFFIGPLAKKAAHKFTNKNTAFIKKILLISLFMVLGMSFCMSFLATTLEHGVNSEFLNIFIKTELRNFIVALPLQIILVGPLARTIFFRIFPQEIKY